MIIEIAAIVSIAALTGVAMLGHVFVFYAMFALADRASGKCDHKCDQLPDDLSEVMA